jgi:signal transduction histidine kinase
MSISRSAGLRAQILLIVLGVAIAPLAIVGLWLTSSAVRSGEELLRRQLDESADRLVGATLTRWDFRQADVALVAGNEASVRAATLPSLSDADRAYLNGLGADLARTIPSIEVRDLSGIVRWSSTPQSRAVDTRLLSGTSDNALSRAASPPVFRVETTINDTAGHAVGVAITDVALSALIPPDSARPLVPGARLGVQNRRAGTVSIALDPTTPFPTATRLSIRGETWLAAHRRVTNPAIDIVIAAPLTAYVAPFKRAGVVGVTALFVVTSLAIVFAVGLATRVTRPLEQLAVASDAVTGGHLAQHVAVAGPAEVRRVSGAFNVMTENLRTTLDALSRRSALAAVGEFAMSLSHDVRNALTSIRVDLDRLSMRELSDPVATTLINRALNSVSRLETSVAGALRVARRGQAPATEVDLCTTIRAAADVVSGTMSSIPATMELQLPSHAIRVRGDTAALQQLFANLLFNAAQALGSGGTTRVVIAEADGFAEVVIADTGAGIPADDVAKLETPFFSTKPNGTGLGLPIARQIAAAHGGSLSIESDEGKGTTVRVRLPLGTKRSPHVNEAAQEPSAVG